MKFKIKENNQKISKTPVASIYKSIDELPMFSNDCIGTYYERMDCSEKAFTKYIINNLEYNLDSFYRFEVSCIIEKDGSIRNVQLEGIKKNNLDNALIDLLQASPKWIPAQNKGKIVTTSINFDIIISPELEEKVKMAPVFSFSEKMPFFPCGCKGSYEEKKVCADKHLLKFIYENIEYPVAAREKGTEGTVFVSFVVEKDGSLSNFKLVENIGNGCGEEALRVVKLMNDLEDRWEPGIQRGQPVRVQFNLPIRFRLE